jgi:hypothetical protein
MTMLNSTAASAKVGEIVVRAVTGTEDTRHAVI